ncbi:EVE domain-containing protein [Candidatus Peregrinibacteria bacterium]|jgi:predicted RNA-binding protein with PUA-like domain|nr:EVE domain-containing protein [Candidatus Peregrinibacteria bacterium]MBT4632136.1 EVE domain-containing protein [Candidatus Peregrinibacteria bacterium]MBT5517032.1 EVE domain-containing protein [Candidatus Peregrinibacteria bacterium]MBT5824054.1 EVE domain-containing protein [Candidatus Peregrinibacteria bacterium]
MNYWLLKTEPDCYNWSEMLTDKKTEWDGIHNYQARNFMREMKKGDKAFFYHTGGERRIMGIVEIIKEAYPDPEDERWTWVDVKMLKGLERPIGLRELKEHPGFPPDMKLFKQGRLSVVPIEKQEWNLILSL